MDKIEILDPLLTLFWLIGPHAVQGNDAQTDFLSLRIII